MVMVRAVQASATRTLGEIYEVTEQEARLLCAKDALGGQKAERVSNRAMKADDVLQFESFRGKDRYSRRDMRAKE